MKNFFYFVAGVLFVTLISATTVSIMTVKPQLPKSTIFFRSGNEEEVRKYLKQGYIIKTIAKGDEWNAFHIVMEKY